MTTTESPTSPRPHCAKYNDQVLEAIRRFLARMDPDRSWRILDAFAGVGLIHSLGWPRSIASELEFEWAHQGGARSQVADACQLPFPDGSIRAYVVSVVWGNRMSDTYAGGGRCRKCQGHCQDLTGAPCERCNGAGVDLSTRHTYTVYLGRRPSRNSAAVLQWGPKYRTLHRSSWAEAARVLTTTEDAWIILDVDDHIRVGERQRVTAWHVNTVKALGFEYMGRATVDSPTLAHGANWETRVADEQVIVFRRRAT